MIRLARTRLVIEYAAFEALRRSLVEQLQPESLEKPLAFWARSGDRTLPLALMNRTINELLKTPFEDLSATRGVGAKKIGGLLQLLGRAVEPTAAPPALQPTEVSVALNNAPLTANSTLTEAASISILPAPNADFEESLWTSWRETVERLGLANETLGRFAPSLLDLPRTLWGVRLGNYLPLRLTEVRALRAHGEKRMKAVLEIFAAIHRSLANVEPSAHLSVCVWPRRVLNLDHWSRGTAQTSGFPSFEEVQHQFVEPLVEQLRVDAGAELADWTMAQLELRSGPSAIEDRDADPIAASQPSGFYRRKLAAIINVRWPEGESHIRAVQARLTDFQATTPAARLFQTAAGMFFPGITTGIPSHEAVADELFQWPRRRPTAAIRPTKRTLRPQPNASASEPRDERSSSRAAGVRYADHTPTLSP
jgi:hypothetical protein